MSAPRPVALRVALVVVGLWHWLVPADRRGDWLREWSAELEGWWLERSARGHGGMRDQLRLVLRSLGATTDAVTLWRHRHRPMASLAADFQHAGRGLRRRPGYAFLVVAVLALAIGATVAVGTVVYAVLLAPLPYPEGERLVMLWDENAELGIERSGPTPANVLDWRQRNRSFSGVAAFYAGEPRTLSLHTGVRKLPAAQVTTDFFATLAMPPLLGRTFDADEVAEERAVVVLSHGLWRTHFGGDVKAIGEQISLDGTAHEVIGVMPANFAVPDGETALWLPWDFGRGYAHLGHVPRDFRFLRVIARLEPGTSLADARADMDRVVARLGEEHEVNRGWQVRVVSYGDELVGDLGPPLLSLAAAVGFVLLIALIDAAHLLLARATGRARELAIRRALGASRVQVAQLVALEAFVLSVVAAALGLGVAWLMFRALLRHAPPAESLDGLQLGFGGVLAAMGLAAITSMVLSAAVARAAGVADAPGALNQRWRGGRGRHSRGRVADGLLVVQVAAAFVLVVLSLLTVQSLRHVLAVDPGFDPHRLLVVRVFPDADKYASVPQRLAYFDELRARLAGLPGVTSVGAASGLPLNPYNNVPSTLYTAADASIAEGGPEADVFMTTEGFFATMGMDVVEGRVFDARDRHESEPVVVINEHLARSVWGRQRAVGRTLRLRFGRDRDVDMTVIGVTRSVRSSGLKHAPRAEAFRPHSQSPYVTMNVVLRTTGDPMALAEPARRQILALDPTQPAHSVTTAAALVETHTAPDRLAMGLLLSLAVLALVLAGAGVYGVMAIGVKLRYHEIGVRMSLGATRGDVVSQILRHGAWLFALGGALGAGMSVVVARVLGGLLYGVGPGDGATLAATAVLLAAVVAVACWRPARQAAGVDPAVTLRAAG